MLMILFVCINWDHQLSKKILNNLDPNIAFSYEKKRKKKLQVFGCAFNLQRKQHNEWERGRLKTVADCPYLIF